MYVGIDSNGDLQVASKANGDYNIYISLDIYGLERLVLGIFWEHATTIATAVQPMQLATMVHMQLVVVRFGCQSFTGPETGF